MPRFVWDELDEEIRQVADDEEMDEGWDERTALTDAITKANGTNIRVFRSDRGHLALDTFAADENEASIRFSEHPEYRDWLLGDDPMGDYHGRNE